MLRQQLLLLMDLKAPELYLRRQSPLGLAGRQSVCVVLTLLAAAAAGLLAGYTLCEMQHLPASHTVHIWARSKQSTSSHSFRTEYAVFSSVAWSPWGQLCTADALHAHSSNWTTGLKQICRLPEIWSNCSKGIYLDIGSNVGVQIRKLYDAHQFPNAQVLSVFEKYFGSNRTDVCAFGIEPNPHHRAYLQTLNSYFYKRGYPAAILTEVAASVRSGNASFFLDPGSPVEWGASLTPSTSQPNNNGSIKATVDLLNLPALVADIIRPILQQELQSTGRMPPVVMKLDVETEEYTLVPGLMLSGGLCDISLLFLEVHPFERIKHKNNSAVPNMTMPEMEAAFTRLRVASPKCRVEISRIDDETYLDGKAIPLPFYNATHG